VSSVSHSYTLSRLRFSHTTTCCGDTYSWPGHPTGTYYCRKCGQPMTTVETEVRTKAEADLAIRGYQFVEPCADCGTRHNHTLIEHDGGLFLVCAGCGEELREVEWKEVKA